MDAVEYFKAREKMTNNCNDCIKCILSEANNNKQVSCSVLEHKYPEIVIEIVEAYSKRNQKK